MINKLLMPLLFAFFAFTVLLNGQTSVDSLINIIQDRNSLIENRSKALSILYKSYIQINLDSTFEYVVKSKEWVTDSDILEINRLKLLSTIYSKKGNNNKALEIFKKIINDDSFNKLNDNDKSKIYALGIPYYKEIGNYQTALDYGQKSLKILHNLEPRQFSRELSETANIGNLYAEIGEFEESNKYFSTVLSFLDSLPTKQHQHYFELGVKNSIGVNQMEQKEYEQALTNFQDVAHLADSLGMIDHYAIAKNNKGLILFYLKSYADALKELDIALETYQKIGNQGGITDVYSDKSEVFYNQGFYGKAINFGLIAYNKNIKDQYLEGQLKDASLLYRAYKKNKNYQSALKFHEIKETLQDSIFSVEKARAFTKTEMNFEFEKEKEILVLQKQKDEAILKAQTRQSRTIAIGIGALALLGFGFFWNARHQNKIIATQNKTLEGLNTTKDRIFAIIGHDLRKPALAFRGITEKVNYLLKNQDFERLNKLGITIEREALSLNKLTDNLLNWALMQRDVLPHNPTNINIKEIIDEVIDLFTTTAVNKNISILSNIDSNLQVLADPDALRIIIRNLIDNAIKYTPHGGTVEIEAEVRNNQVQINIIDDGIGMEQHKLQSMFLLQKDKSKRGTAGEKGTGLGLHLVEELIKINKGSIKAMSQLGQGTSFNVALPIAK